MNMGNCVQNILKIYLFAVIVGDCLVLTSTWRSDNHPTKHHQHDRSHDSRGRTYEHIHKKHKLDQHRKVERHANHLGLINEVATLDKISWPNFPKLSHTGKTKHESTTQDPSIPENPVGLTDPSLLIGPYEEAPDLQKTEASFVIPQDFEKCSVTSEGLRRRATAAQRGRNGSIVAAQIGMTANISCIVVNRRDHETVSWIRLRDHHVITVGRQTYSSDARFSVTYNRHNNEWILHLRFVQNRDAGQYVCQLSTHPAMVFVRTLKITEAVAMIDGGSQRIVEEGSVVRLNCTLKYHSQSPDFVFWYHNKSMINFDENRQVEVKKTKDGSILTLVSVSKTDSGNYTCVPPKTKPASIMLHVILDDAPAAMQVSRGAESYVNEFLYVFIMFVGHFL